MMWSVQEGRMDSQTIYGKMPMGVASTAKRYDVPVIGIAGSLADGHEVVHEHGIDVVFTIVPAYAASTGRCGMQPQIWSVLRAILRRCCNTAVI